MVQQEMTLGRLFELIKAGKVDSIVNELDPSTGLHMFTGTFKTPVSNAPNAPEVDAAFKVPVDFTLDPALATEIEQAGYTKRIETESNTNWLLPIITSFLPILIFVGLMYFLFRQQIRMAGKSCLLYTSRCV